MKTILKNAQKLHNDMISKSNLSDFNYNKKLEYFKLIEALEGFLIENGKLEIEADCDGLIERQN